MICGIIRKSLIGRSYHMTRAEELLAQVLKKEKEECKACKGNGGPQIPQSTAGGRCFSKR
jgi:hypothetical protein